MAPAQPLAHRLFLMRHAQAANTASGHGDAARTLTKHGRAQARAAGEVLADAQVDLILCSTATRTQQTAELLGLSAPIDYRSTLYNAGAHWIAGELAGVADWVRTVLVVAHAPGVPALAHNLASGDSDPEALAVIDRYFPPGTLVGMEFTGPWASLDEARLVMARRG